MSEARLEEKFIEKLCNVGYERVDITNFDELENNLRLQLNRLNEIELTDTEFNEIKRELKNKRIFDAARFLRSLYLLKRDDKSQKHVYFYDVVDYERNIFQVTNQFKVKGTYNNNRYDVTILVNGLPLIHIELKKNTVDVTSAFHQIERYKKESMNETYFEYVQLFIVSNENMTHYTSNNEKLSKQYLYDWKDEKNKVVGNLFEFTDSFLEKSKIAKYLAKFIILSEDYAEGNTALLAMRSYQVQAADSIVRKVQKQDGNGYVWHTTGSGKTLTSFKAAQLVSEMKHIDKVLFVVDRVDLDKQTVEEYNKFIDKAKNQSSNEDGSIVTVQSTSHLKELLENNIDRIIVTTIQKLDNLTKKAKLKKDLNCVLIFDECHRSQLGDMHKNIDKYFNYPQKFGFTGTPIMAQNRKDQTGEMKTTSDVFGEKLHTYLINDAISDGNVLGFSIDYNKVLKLKDESKIQDNEVQAIDTKELFESTKYIKSVAKDVIDTYDKFTHKSKYNAMLATSGISSAVKYYNLLTGREVDGEKLEIPDSFKDKKIVCVYSVNDNEAQAKSGMNNREAINLIIKDYNDNFNKNYSYENMSEYKADVARKVKLREADLLIVSDMFLTGFDAKQLNTLYFDKKQQYHNLIQSVSRTNRIYDESKDYGQIIFYQPSMKKVMDDALELFSNPNSDVSVIKEDYREVLKKTIDQINVLLFEYSDFDVVNNLHKGQEQKDYLLVVRNVLRCLNAIDTYREYDISQIPISQYLIDQHTAAYKAIYAKSKPKQEKESVLEDFDFEIELIKSDTIDYDYIKNMLSKVDNSITPDEEVLNILNKFEFDPNLKSKYELLKYFFEKYYQPESTQNVPEQFEQAKNQIIIKKINRFAAINKLNSEKIIELNEEYKYNNDYSATHDIEREVTEGLNFLIKDDVKQNLRNFIENEINNTVISVEDLIEL